jgi:hypothetical protein
MEILLTIAIYVVAIAISTVVFGASLFLVEDIKESSFRIDGPAVTWGKCAGLVVVMLNLKMSKSFLRHNSIMAVYRKYKPDSNLTKYSAIIQWDTPNSGGQGVDRCGGLRGRVCARSATF